MPLEPHLLVVDDDPDIRDGLRRYLEDNGYRVTVAESAAAARRLLGRNTYSLAICDIMMPGEDGLSLCKHMHATTDTPVILLTARADDADRIVGLEIGADDYVTKPFNPRELLARIKVFMRRIQDSPARHAKSTSAQHYEFDRWRLDTAQRELVDQSGVVVPLSSGEFALLLILVEQESHVLTRHELHQATRPGSGDPDGRSIDNQISRLRRKIEADPKNPRIIKTVWNGGYTFAGTVKRS
jgi:two-component system OmpR family response regulator